MAKPISQSDTRWVPVKRNAAGKKIGGGYVEQISTGEKVTGKVKIVKNGSTTNVGGIADYRKGKNVTGKTMIGGAKGAPKGTPTGGKARGTSGSQKPGNRNVSPASSAGAAPSTPAAAAKPGTASVKANQKALTATAKKAAAARAKKVDKGTKAGTRYPAPVAPRKAQSGYQAGKGQRAPMTPIEQFGANVSRLWASTTAREDAAKKAKAAKAAKTRAEWRKKYGIQ